MPSLQTNLIRCMSLLVSLCLFAGLATAAETDADGRRYAPSAEPVADVHNALERARENGRRALVVMGANWCHDSRALASRLYQSPLAEVIDEEYELVFVDVGYYKTGSDVLDELGIAQFYATPTVLIVEPNSKQVINNEDRHIWGGAYNISMSSSVDYFETWADKALEIDPAEDSAALRELNAQIDQFERRQAERVAGGYAVVGPMLEQRAAGNSPEDYSERWAELRDFRNAIPRDVQALRDEARRRVLGGEETIELEFPQYAALSWEAN